MKFNVSSSKLFAQLQAVSRVIAAKNSLQILEAVLFDLEGDVLTLTASDSETTIRTSLTAVKEVRMVVSLSDAVKVSTSPSRSNNTASKICKLFFAAITRLTACN